MKFNRIYKSLLINHIKNWKQMLFVEGPRQAGKTTLAKEIATEFSLNMYLNYDNLADRSLLMSGQNFIEKTGILEQPSENLPVIILDEFHKMPDWKNYLKGFFDVYRDRVRIIVTGSAKLTLYKKGQDSLMGRYFPYTILPLSYGELLNSSFIDEHVRISANDDDIFDRLYKYGGFPENYSQQNEAFHLRWKSLRFQQLFREDINDIEDIKNIGQLELLAFLLQERAGSQLNYTNLAKAIKVADQTVRKWMTMLETFYFGFLIKSWSNNISRSILKEPKFYLTDWSSVMDPGAKAENFIAAHLQKAVYYWNNKGVGEYSLHYIRDKEKREVDFVVIKNNQPWFLVEVKLSNNSGITKNMHYFQKATGAKHAFQVVIDLPYQNINCFDYNTPVIVPARTFLSQLI